MMIFFTMAQIEDIATYLNDKVDIPFLMEQQEQILFEGIIGLVVRTGQNYLPTQWGNLFFNESEGLNPDREDELGEWLARCITKNIDLPCLTEHEAEKIIWSVVRVMIGGLLKGQSLKTQTSGGEEWGCQHSFDGGK